MDTIFALASAEGKAGVAVIRVSGPAAFSVVRGMTGSDVPARQAVLRTLVAQDKTFLDQAVVLGFPGPSSFTGENVVELQVHGSQAVVSAILHDLSEYPNLRLAEPGEFTRRAMDNGKLDLSQVEGLADLIDAETEAQRRQAQVTLSGALGKLADRWRTDLIRAAALIEATIDFADEDVPTDVTPEVSELLTSVLVNLKQETASVKIAERIRSGFEVAIVGAPNVGKSTLLNALAGRNAAITSEFAGTTRDVIEVRMDLGGLAVTLLDTAGLRETSDVVEGMGIQLARDRAAASDLRVFLADPSDELDIEFQAGDIRVTPKADLRLDKSNAVSGVTGDGIENLISQISGVLVGKSASAGIATRQRHKVAMTRAVNSLQSAQMMLESGPDHYDIVSEELRTAIRALESLVGRVDVENLLDEIFSSFCVGK